MLALTISGRRFGVGYTTTGPGLGEFRTDFYVDGQRVDRETYRNAIMEAMDAAEAVDAMQRTHGEACAVCCGEG
jgi:hypothetical protein